MGAEEKTHRKVSKNQAAKRVSQRLANWAELCAAAPLDYGLSCRIEFVTTDGAIANGRSGCRRHIQWMRRVNELAIEIVAEWLVLISHDTILHKRTYRKHPETASSCMFVGKVGWMSPAAEARSRSIVAVVIMTSARDARARNRCCRK